MWFILSELILPQINICNSFDIFFLAFYFLTIQASINIAEYNKTQNNIITMFLFCLVQENINWLMFGAHLIKAWVVAWMPLAVSAACDTAASGLPLAVCLIA